ncbi:MAG: protein-methionine-sulfoxide reductase catalytic subunit MsrP [Myxococcota bacterium]
MNSMKVLEKRIWDVPASRITPEAHYRNRRQFLRDGAQTLVAGALLGCAHAQEREAARRNQRYEQGMLERFGHLYPASPHPDFATSDRALTDAAWATGYNNFYEFGTNKQKVQVNVGPFEPTPWQVEVTGLVHKPAVFDLDALMRLGLEERVYRHRCVEAWAMTVPWTGFPLRSLLQRVEPMASAKYVRFASFNRPEQAIGIRNQKWYPWPYYEALRISEATHRLTFLATGVYGKPLPKQNGAPVRLVVPWKYGYKSAKSITRIELTEKKPDTFWVDLAPAEYTFLSNVNPRIPHPRWSQATERLIGTDQNVATQLFNGYAEVASLYRDREGRE